MTEELKTLKDLMKKDLKIDPSFDSISVRKLKAEAIKWVKYWEKIGHHYITPIEFMDFFNITEEDLKNE